MYLAVWFDEVQQELIKDMDAAPATIRADYVSEIDEAIKQTITTATEAGKSNNGARRGKELFLTFKHVLRIKLVSDAPDFVEPYSITLKPNKTIQDNNGKYAPAQASFLTSTIKFLEQLGAITGNHTEN